MQAPKIPADDAKRVRALRTLCILDTAPQERFDRITRLACHLFKVPMAFISLVDRDRQWFKSKQGLQAEETSRRVSFCGHAILEDRPFVVPDAQSDPRFADNPLVLDGPRIRSYAGVPVHGPDRALIGTICVIDAQPRKFSAEDMEMLKDLAAMVDRELSIIEQSTIDELTGLSNRRGLTMIAGHVLELCRTERKCAVLLDFSINDFKSFNDARGAKAGDELLRGLAEALQSHFSGADVVARLNGVEFAVLYGGMTTEQMDSSLVKLKRDFATTAIAQSYPQLACSGGVAQFDPASEDTIDDLLRAADFRRYREKVETATLRQLAG